MFPWPVGRKKKEYRFLHVSVHIVDISHVLFDRLSSWLVGLFEKEGLGVCRCSCIALGLEGLFA